MIKIFHLLLGVVVLAGSLARAGDPPPRTPTNGRPVRSDERKAPKILMVLTSHGELGLTGRRTGFYLSEAAHPYAMFLGHGLNVDFVSPIGGKVPVEGAEGTDDPVALTFLSDRLVKHQLDTTRKAQDVDPADYVAIFFVGGHGAMWDFPDDPALQNLAAKVYEAGGVVAAVCHGPAALLNVKLADGSYLISGKTMSCFTNEEEAARELTGVVPFLLESKLIERGATVDKAEPFQSKVVTAGRLVTGQNPASATGVAEKVVQLLAAH